MAIVVTSCFPNVVSAQGGGVKPIIIAGSGFTGFSGTITIKGTTAPGYTVLDDRRISVPLPAIGSFGLGDVIVGGVGTGNNLIRIWDPIVLSTFSAFFDAELGVTSGPGVSQWNDQGAGANNVVQASGPNQPTYTASDFGSMHGMSYAAANVLTTASGQVALASGLSYAGGIKTTESSRTTQSYAGDAANTVIGDSSGSINNGFGLGGDANGAGTLVGQLAYNQYIGSWQTVSGGAQLNDGIPRMVVATHNSGTGDINLYKSTDLLASGNYSYGGTNGWLSIGGGFDIADNFRGDMAWALIVDAVLSATDQLRLDIWSYQRWGTESANLISYAPAGWFDRTDTIQGWFGPTAQVAGWFDKLLLAEPAPPAAAPTRGYPFYQDFVPRPGPASLATVFQMAFAMGCPIASSAPTPTALTEFPDGPEFRRKASAEQSPAWSFRSMRPEQKIEIPDTSFDDFARGRPFPVAEQSVTTGISPRPERKSPIASARFDDTAPRVPALPSALHLAVTSETPRPERTSPLAFPRFDDTASSHWLTPPLFMAVTGESPMPDRTSVLAAAIFPDFAPGRPMPVVEQVAVTERPPFTDRTSTIAWSRWDDFAPGRALISALQMGPTEISPLPIPNAAALTPVGLVCFPDIVPAPRALGTSAQLAPSAEPARPEITLPADFARSFPDRIPFATLPVAAHPFFAANIAPERVSPIAASVFADFATGKAFRAVDQHAVTEISPKPETILSRDWATAYPDFTPGRWLATALHPFLGEAPAPERTQALAWSWSPDFAPGRSLPTSAQAYTTSEPARPERTSPLAVVSFPDTAPRGPALATAIQEAPSAFYALPFPNTAAPVEGYAGFPDFAPRPVALVTADHLFVTGLSPLPIPTPIVLKHAMPDWLATKTLSTAQVPAAGFSPAPERKATLAATSFPDMALRAPALLAAAHLAVTSEPTKPELTVPADWQPVYPDRAIRSVLPTADQQFAALAPRPERTSPIASLRFDDRIYPRAALHPSLQASAAEYPAPIVSTSVTLGWLPNFPDQVRGAYFPVNAHQAFTSAPMGVLLKSFWPHLWARVRKFVSLGLAGRELVHADTETRPLVAIGTDTRPYASLSPTTRPLITIRAFSRPGDESMTKLGGTEQLDVDISTRVNSSDTPVDPSTLVLTVKDPLGNVTTYSIAGGQVTKRNDASGSPMTGKYTCAVVCSTAAGTWNYRWVADIGKPGIEENAFTVTKLSF